MLKLQMLSSINCTSLSASPRMCSAEYLANQPIFFPRSACSVHLQNLVSIQLLVHNIRQPLTIHPSPLEQTPSDIQELWLLPRETLRWRRAAHRLLQHQALPEPSPSACTDLTRQWLQVRPSNNLAYCSRSALRSRSCAGVGCTVRLCRGCGTRAKTTAKSDSSCPRSR